MSNSVDNTKNKKKIYYITVGSDIVSLIKDVCSKICSIGEMWTEKCSIVPMPKKHNIIAVKKSPHVNSKSGEKFIFTMHKRLIVLVNPKQECFDKISNLNVNSGVQFNVKSI